MRLTITIDCGNAAFGDEPGPEVARILRQLAGDFEDAGDFLPGTAEKRLRDVNGNACGRVTVTPEE